MDKLLAVLKHAQNFEKKGYEFYLKASEKVKNPVVSSVLSSLAFDENSHELMIDRYYVALQNGQGWPSRDEDCNCEPEDERLAKIARDITKKLDSDSNYLEVYETALEMEKASYDYYQSQAEIADDKNVEKFFSFLANLEFTHMKMLNLMVEGIRAA